MTSPPSDARPHDRGPGGGPEDPLTLLDRARRLSAAGGHPAAGGAWVRAATAVRRAGGAITPRDHADALDATALDCRGGARPAAQTLFSRAADLHERAGLLGKALISRARALTTGPEPGATACAGLAELCERAADLHAAGRATVAQTATVLLLRSRARADLLGTAPDPAAEAAALRAELVRLVAFAAPHRADPAVLGPLADSRALLGRVTAPEDPATALAHLRAAVVDHAASERPWPPTETELLLAGVLRAAGAHAEAATVLRTAIGSGEESTLLRAADGARLRLALARTLEEGAGQGLGLPASAGGEEVVALLTEAVRLSDRSGEDPLLGVLARLRLGRAHAAGGRWQEAATVLEEVLAAPARNGDQPARLRARAWLAFCALRRGEPERAARQYALAAAEARLRADLHQGAALSHRAAHALGAAGAPEKAARAYERAADLWRSAGEHGAAARSLRARARQVRAARGAARAEVVLEEALREAQRGLRGTPQPAERDRLRAELVLIREELTVLHALAAGADGPRADNGRPDGPRTDDPGTDDLGPDGFGANAFGADGLGTDAFGTDAFGADASAAADLGPWSGPWSPPDPYEVSGHYQVNVYGDVGRGRLPAATAPRTRVVQGCV
ncbi:hypothetical protein [Streptomyces sp. NPDC015130]|uniref:hypothetical protein n=1 Tax=Streptomyces sp. NPDC015130 TaxID=3364940 RepID=UPI0036FFA3EA